MVVRMRHTRAHTRNRRAHHALEEVNISNCKKCGQPVLPHTLCMNCGNYRDKELIDTLAKLTKKERKQKEKEMKAKEENEKTLDPAKLSNK